MLLDAQGDLVPPSTGRAQCSPTVRSPAARDSQAKPVAGSSSVTRQRAVGSRGWETTASLPTRSGPSSSRRIERIEGVHSCHRSTSRITGTTAAGAAPIRTTYSSCTTWYTVPSGT